MAFALLYADADTQRIQDSFNAVSQGPRSGAAWSAADQNNVNAVWSAGLNTWNTANNKVYNPGPPETWDTVCLNADGTPKPGLCDVNTRKIPINGTWAANGASYGAQRNQPITRAGFVGLLKRMGNADPDTIRGGWIANALADDLASTALEPYP